MQRDNAYLISGQRRKRWVDIDPELGQCLVFTRMVSSHLVLCFLVNHMPDRIYFEYIFFNK